MTAIEIVNQLLEEQRMDEATVRRPPRSKKWVAVYTGEERGVQIARSTGLTNKAAALTLARAWEKEAREKRLLKPRPVTSTSRNAALTQAEVASLLGMSERAVRAIERRALRKLRSHPELKELWREHTIDEAQGRRAMDLTSEEVVALHGLAHSREEETTIKKAIRIVLS